MIKDEERRGLLEWMKIGLGRSQVQVKRKTDDDAEVEARKSRTQHRQVRKN